MLGVIIFLIAFIIFMFSRRKRVRFNSSVEIIPRKDARTKASNINTDIIKYSTS